MAADGLTNPFTATVKRAARLEKLVTLLLLFILLTAAAAGVSAVLTGPDWVSLWLSLLLGLLAGWVLALFRWPAWRSALVVVALGILLSFVFATGLGKDLFAIFGELLRLIGQAIRTLSLKQLDFSTLSDLTRQLFSSIAIVSLRVFTWVKDLATSQPAFDPVAAGVVWKVVVWLVAAWAGWIVEAKKNALLATLPALLLNLGILSYGQHNSASIYLILGATLVLIPITQFDRYEQAWDETRVLYPARKGREVGNISLFLAIALVLLAAFLSSLSLPRLIHWTSTLSKAPAQPESGLAKSLGIVPAAPSPADAFTNIRNPGLPRELLIGAGPELSTEQVMSVEVRDLVSLVQAGQLPPLYWRSYTYDIYTGHGWSSSATDLSQYQADQPVQPEDLPNHQSIQEVVRLVPGEEGTIYAAGEPVSISVASQAAWRSSNDLFGIQMVSGSYAIQSLIPVTDENSLRASGQAYPKWITQRYLALPSEVPERVKELALQLTASELTPYDRARAIEGYLRESYPYTLDVPRPPTNQDLVDYFLFQLRKGYCDYYASAMVVLARAAGIPARLAVGYATGTLNEKTTLFTVTQAQAHSWVEVYFPGTGWVPFEPTAGLPPINRASGALESSTPMPATPPAPIVNFKLGNLGKFFGSIIALSILVIGASWAVLDEVSMRRRHPLATAREIYRRLRIYAHHLSVPLEGGETPYELEAALAGRIAEISGREDELSTQVKAAQVARTLIRKIVHMSYGTNTGAIDGKMILRQWRGLRWQLRLLWAMSWWQGLMDRSRERLPGLGEDVKLQAG